MLMRSEPFTEVNRLAQQLFGAPATGTWSRPTAMPVDAYRNGDEFVIAFDLPGVDKDAIDIDIERNVLTVRAERRPVDLGDAGRGAPVRTAARRLLPPAVPRRRPGHRPHRRDLRQRRPGAADPDRGEGQAPQDLGRRSRRDRRRRSFTAEPTGEEGQGGDRDAHRDCPRSGTAGSTRRSPTSSAVTPTSSAPSSPP